MPFESGHKKIGGRTASTPNKRTQSLIDILKANDFDPVAELVRWSKVAGVEYERAEEIYDAICDKRASLEMMPLATTEATQWAKLGIQSALGILPYLYPKRKAAEGVLDITPEQADKMSTEELVKHGKELLKQFEGKPQ